MAAGRAVTDANLARLRELWLAVEETETAGVDQVFVGRALTLQHRPATLASAGWRHFLYTSGSCELSDRCDQDGFHLLVCKMAEQGELPACPASAEGQAAKAAADTAAAEKASAAADKAAAQKAAAEKIVADKRAAETAAAEKEAAAQAQAAAKELELAAIAVRKAEEAKDEAARLAKIDKLLKEAGDMMEDADYENAAKTYALALSLDPQATHPRHDEILPLQTEAEQRDSQASASHSFAHCPGRRPPFWVVKRPARPHRSAIENRFA